jgi:Single-strand binding protein family
MATDNTVILIGNLTDDPELRLTTNGAAVANFRLAVTPRIRQGDQWTDGEGVSQTDRPGISRERKGRYACLPNRERDGGTAAAVHRPGGG